ncbi:MAG: type II secretion system protein [Phycisphaerae bacterium]|nr:type II secretion system protein [Phycisphaerae bacterium]
MTKAGMNMTFRQRKSAAAFTLIEAMIAALIVTIVIVGTSFLFAVGRGQINQQKNYRAAAQLATQRLEQLKGGDYAAVVSGSSSYSLEGVSYATNTVIENVGSLYKKVTVTVSWGPPGSGFNVSLVTIIAPE